MVFKKVSFGDTCDSNKDFSSSEESVEVNRYITGYDYILNGNLILNLMDEQILLDVYTDILRYIYKQIPINYFEMKKLYLKHPSKMNYDYNKDRDGIYPFIRFRNSDEEDGLYVYKFNPDLDEKYYAHLDLIHDMHDFLSNHSAKKLKLFGVVSLQLENLNGINSSSKGIRDIDWKLHQWNQYLCSKDNGITFHDLIIAAHKITSHKFEDNFEMFDKVVSITSNEYFGGNKYSLEMVVQFLHKN